MARIDEVVAQQRAALLSLDAQAANRLIRAYGTVYQRINRDLGRLVRQIQRLEEAGEEISPAKLFSRGRLESLKAQTEIQIARFAEFAEAEIAATQREAVDLGRQHSLAATQAALPPVPTGGNLDVRAAVNWQRLPDDVFEDLVGRLSDGSPLRDLLSTLPQAAAEGLESALLNSVAQGINPVAATKAARNALGANLQRALTISRTEVIRSYREASRRDYLANERVLSGWTWSASGGPRTCPACWAMHGTFHTLDETLDGHPNCRCAMVPRTKSWEELGFTGIEDNRPTVEDGEDLFATQSESIQRAVLGKEGYRLYSEGEVKLAQFVGQRESEDWGTMRYTRSLKQISADPTGDKYKPGIQSSRRSEG